MLWSQGESNPPHGACKALSPPWNMRPHCEGLSPSRTFVYVSQHFPSEVQPTLMDVNRTYPPAGQRTLLQVYGVYTTLPL